MKKGIHPEYKKTTIKCACGNTLETMSTKEDVRVEICSACHPIFTGKQKFIDTLGRVDKFEARRRKAEEMNKNKETKETKVVEEVTQVDDEKIREIEKELVEETVDITEKAKEENPEDSETDTEEPAESTEEKTEESNQ